jgi:hypothetical protein
VGETGRLPNKEANAESNPFDRTKNNLLLNLNQQLKAAEAMVAGEVYMVEKMKTVTENGENIKKLIRSPIRRWYWRDSTGLVRFAVRASNKRIELSKGMTDIVVGNDTELPKTVNRHAKVTHFGG